MPYQQSPKPTVQQPVMQQKVKPFQPDDDDFYDDDFEANERDDYGTVKTLASTGVQIQANKFESPARGKSSDYGFYQPDSARQQQYYSDDRPI